MVIFALTIVRHGETGHNKDNVIQGQLDVPLSTVGINQAQTLGNHLQNQKYTHVYASDLSRAKLTAESILEKSKVCNVSIVEDKRLRERKFGVIEGKSFKYLKEVATKSNQSVLQMTPLGAETVQQVQSRAISFFKELCQSMCALDPSFQAARRNSDEISRNKQQQTSNGTSNVVISSVASSLIRNKRKHEDSLEKRSQQDPSNNYLRIISKVESSSAAAPLLIQQEKEQISDSSNKILDNSCAHECASSLTVVSSSSMSMSISELENLSKVSPTFSDETIRSHLTPCKCEKESSDCPNVSLSPLVSQNTSQSGHEKAPPPPPPQGPLIQNRTNLMVDHSLIQIQAETLATTTTTSGGSLLECERERRTSICSSNDENESSTDLTGNILVVSHGGLLKELVRYFVEELSCFLPGGQKQAMRISPNAGLSKFTISLNDENDERPKIICHQIHDKDHLDEICPKGKGGGAAADTTLYGNPELTAL